MTKYQALKRVDTVSLQLHKLNIPIKLSNRLEKKKQELLQEFNQLCPIAGIKNI